MSPPAGGAALVALWLFVGIFGGTAIWLGERFNGAPTTWAAAVIPAIGAALLWIPLTLVGMHLARRFPLRGSRRGRALFVHGLAALAVSFVLNFFFVAGVVLVTGREPGVGGLLAMVGAEGFRYLHINAFVYLVIVAATQVWDARGATGAWAPGARVAVAGAAGIGTSGEADAAAASAGADDPAWAQRLEARSAGRVTLLDVDDIEWIEADGDYARVHVGDAEHLVAERMKHLEARLDPSRFVRIHRSRIVNIERVRELRHLAHGDYEVTLACDTRLRVSRARRRQLLAAVEQVQG